MLNPDTRHLLTDALSPPTGWKVDAAIATTYTLDLSSLLLAPLSMAAYEQAEDGLENAAPHELLEAIRRYAGRTTVFCQAGGIHVPSTYRKLTVFAEDSIVEVMPPASRVFHPKIWVLRFTSPSGGHRHRLVCLSRNLTGDRSWDTVLTANENESAAHHMSAAPLATFVEDLIASSVRPIPDDRVALLQDIAETVRDRPLEVPAPFTSGALFPIGTSGGGSWPVPTNAERTLIISPFLDATTVKTLKRPTTIVSRPETFDRLGAAALDGHALRVLQPQADAPPEVIEDDVDPGGGLEVKTGLHAKVLAWDEGATGSLLTGSANATSAAFGGNIEFGVLLSGPVEVCGAAAILRDDDKTTGLVRLLQPHVPSEERVPDTTYELEREIEAFHAALAGGAPELHVTPEGDGYHVWLGWEAPPPLVGRSWVRPITLRDVNDRPLEQENVWHGLGLTDLTPLFAVRTRLRRDDVTVERSCAIRAVLSGAPDDRARRVLRDLLSNTEDVLRYLALLLKDPAIDDVASALLEVSADAENGTGGGHWTDDLVLLEPLARAFARDDDALDQVESLLDDLRDDEGRLPDLGPDFESLWRVVSAARAER